MVFAQTVFTRAVDPVIPMVAGGALAAAGLVFIALHVPCIFVGAAVVMTVGIACSRLLRYRTAD